MPVYISHYCPANPFVAPEHLFDEIDHVIDFVGATLFYFLAGKKQL